MTRSDPLQLPETAGDGPRLDAVSAAWLTWVAVSIIAALAGAYVLALVGLVGIELAVAAFAWGMAWSAATPQILRATGRRVR